MLKYIDFFGGSGAPTRAPGDASPLKAEDKWKQDQCRKAVRYCLWVRCLHAPVPKQSSPPCLCKVPWVKPPFLCFKTATKAIFNGSVQVSGSKRWQVFNCIGFSLQSPWVTSKPPTVRPPLCDIQALNGQAPPVWHLSLHGWMTPCVTPKCIKTACICTCNIQKLSCPVASLRAPPWRASNRKAKSLSPLFTMHGIAAESPFHRIASVKLPCHTGFWCLQHFGVTDSSFPGRRGRARTPGEMPAPNQVKDGSTAPPTDWVWNEAGHHSWTNHQGGKNNLFS